MVKNTEATFTDISLKELLLLALKQWRKILCVGIIFMILSGTFYFSYEKPKKAEEIKTLETEITTVKSELHGLQKYYYSSIYYQLPEVFFQGNLTIMVKGYENGALNDGLTKSLVSAYLGLFSKDGDIYQEINNTLEYPYYDLDFLRQVISTSYKENTYIFTIKVIHFDLEKEKELINIIIEKLQNQQKNLSEKIGDHNLIVVSKTFCKSVDSVVTKNVYAANKRVKDCENQLKLKQNNLSSLQKSQNISISLLKYMVVGLLGGFIFCYILFCLCYLFSSKVKTANQIKYNYSVEILGEFINNKKSKFDKFISGKAGEPVDINTEEMAKIVEINITSMEPNIKNLLILSSKDVTETSDLFSTLSENSNLKDYNIEFAQSFPNNNRETLQKISNAEEAVVIVKKLKTSLSELEREFEIIESYGKKIVGVILVE